MYSLYLYNTTLIDPLYYSYPIVFLAHFLGLGMQKFKGQVGGVKVQVVDTTGAGDAFCAGLLSQIASNPNIMEVRNNLYQNNNFSHYLKFRVSHSISLLNQLFLLTLLQYDKSCITKVISRLLTCVSTTPILTGRGQAARCSLVCKCLWSYHNDRKRSNSIASRQGHCHQAHK